VSLSSTLLETIPISGTMVSTTLMRGATPLRSLMAKRTMATVQSRIGDKKVEMSNLEKGRFINYQRIEDTLQVVRSR
jgi:aconitate hydratase